MFLDWIMRRGDGVPASTRAEPQEQVTSDGGSYENKVVRVQGMQSLKVSPWYRAVELRSKTMGQLVIELQRWNKVERRYVPHRIGTGARLNYLLGVRPNPMMTAAVMMQQAEINIMMAGNAYIYIQRDKFGDAEALWLATNGSYSITTNQYAITYDTPGGAVSKTADSSDVIHIANTFRRGQVGISTLTYASEVLNLSATENRESLENAAKGGKMKVIIQQDKPMQQGVLSGGLVNKDRLKKYAREVSEEAMTQDFIALHGVTNVTPISMNAQQLQLLESRGFNVSEVARMTGVPKALLMDDSQSHYNTPAAATQEFLLRTIQPKIREWEDELNSKLLGEAGYGSQRVRLNTSALLRLDNKTQAEIDKLHLETGVMSVNELREEHNMPMVKNGDVHYVSANLRSISALVADHEQ